MCRIQIGQQNWNTNLLVFGPPNTRLTEIVLEKNCLFSADPEIYKERLGSDTIQPWTWYWLWNEGIAKGCEFNWACGISRVPITYTDGFKYTEKPQEGMGPCEDGEETYFKGARLPLKLYSLFTWHARFAKYDDACVEAERPTITGAVRRRINELLDGGLDMGGRDLFPGPLFSS
jgi:hypothetical protein